MEESELGSQLNGLGAAKSIITAKKMWLKKSPPVYIVLAKYPGFLEEVKLLAQSIASCPIYDVNAFLLGIGVHRASAALVMMTVLAFQLHSRNRAS